MRLIVLQDEQVMYNTLYKGVMSIIYYKYVMGGCYITHQHAIYEDITVIIA